MPDTPTPPATPDVARCKLCGEPMPPGEEMFQCHGYSGPCPKPPKPETCPTVEGLSAELEKVAGYYRAALQTAADNFRGLTVEREHSAALSQRVEALAAERDEAIAERDAARAAERKNCAACLRAEAESLEASAPSAGNLPIQHSYERRASGFREAAAWIDRALADTAETPGGGK